MLPLEKLWYQYKEPLFKHRRFKHRQILPLILKSSWEKEEIGFSYEERPIMKLTWGNGPICILMWSQMHGNEATATMALFDLINCLSKYQSLVYLKDKITLHIVPMLNPDGAERFQRRTAQGIDLNRDALALQSPEAKILAKLQHKLKPHFSFNLHDQDIRYAAGENGKQTAIAFLATAFNAERTWNNTRTKAGQIIGILSEFLAQYIPDKIAKFSDEFEPRAFGDCIQQWGSSLILIESGGYLADSEKMHLRMLNFMLFIKALETIANENYQNESLDKYHNIPNNTRCLYDLYVKNVTHKGAKIDIGINLTEINSKDATTFDLESVVEEIGDLRSRGGLNVFEATGYEVKAFSNYPSLAGEIPKRYQNGLRFGKKAYFILSKDNVPCYSVNNGILNKL